MIPTSVCVGCFPGQNTSSLWPNTSYSDPHIYSYTRKPQSFHISDILQMQNSMTTGSILQQSDMRNSSHVSMCHNSALGPLQAFCTTKNVQNFVSSSNKSEESIDCPSNSSSQQSKSLKFGMNRILSEEFGKAKNEKENRLKQQKSPTPRQENINYCDCGSRACPVTFYSKYSFPSPVLSAVHAIQPPQYHISSHGIDTLPGPYSILNDDGSVCNQSKRKRSWSRAVFSNLQRKGLEKRFEVQKYVTKPDRRQLAAMLGLTDAQVKVWFQNRRMKWRHAQQMKDKETSDVESKVHVEVESIRQDDIHANQSDNDSRSSCDDTNET